MNCFVWFEKRNRHLNHKGFFWPFQCLRSRITPWFVFLKLPISKKTLPHIASDDQVLSLYDLKGQGENISRQSNGEVRFPERYACRDLQYVLSPQLLMIPRREKEVPRQYRFLRYTWRFFFSSSFRSFVRLKYSQRVILYKSSVELLFLWNIV